MEKKKEFGSEIEWTEVQSLIAFIRCRLFYTLKPDSEEKIEIEENMALKDSSSKKDSTYLQS
jgi:hypothetical protein